jgi:PAS domain-containing protein
LKQVDALTVLQWIESPALAVERDGSVVFANWAFADMIGYTPEMVRALTFCHVFTHSLVGETPMSALRAHADLIVDLVHLDGSPVRARMSEPLVLGEDELALVTFDDMTEELWLQEM